MLDSGAVTTFATSTALAPAVAEARREHAVALARPMLGTPMAGDPWFDDLRSGDPLLTRRACQYATALLLRDPQFQGDLSGLRATFKPPATVRFHLAASVPKPSDRGERGLIATIVIPARVMSFNPHRRALPMKAPEAAPHHPIPDAALEADIAIVGKKGRGKTYTAKALVEKLLDMGRRVIVLDPLSTWWGLKAGDLGYPIAVIGGPHGDLPLSDQDGAALGRHLATTAQSAVLDLGAMRKAELVRFATPFLEELYTANREPLTLVLEEADVFAPQQPMADNARLLGEVDRIARRGRQFGFRLISLTQRPAKLNKDVLTQLSTLVALGITSPQDRDAIKAWVEGNADRDKAREVVDSLAGLRVGEGWVWAPDLDFLERVTFPRIRTPDTSATPKAGESRHTVTLRQDVDLAGLRAALSTGALDDPSGTRERGSAQAIEEAERSGYDRGYAEGVASGRSQAIAFVDGQVKALAAAVERFRSGQAAEPTSHQEALSKVKGREPGAGQPPAARNERGLGPSAGERKLIAALECDDSAPISWETVAIRAGYVATGGGFLLAKKALRSRGFVDETMGGVILREVISAKPVPTEAALVDLWSKRLGPGPAKLLRAISKHGGSLPRAGLAGLTGYVATGGGFLRAAKALRTANLVEQVNHTFRLTPAFRRAAGAPEAGARP